MESGIEMWRMEILLDIKIVFGVDIWMITKILMVIVFRLVQEFFLGAQRRNIL